MSDEFATASYLSRAAAKAKEEKRQAENNAQIARSVYELLNKDKLPMQVSSNEVQELTNKFNNILPQVNDITVKFNSMLPQMNEIISYHKDTQTSQLEDVKVFVKNYLIYKPDTRILVGDMNNEVVAFSREPGSLVFIQNHEVKRLLEEATENKIQWRQTGGLSVYDNYDFADKEKSDMYKKHYEDMKNAKNAARRKSASNSPVGTPIPGQMLSPPPLVQLHK